MVVTKQIYFLTTFLNTWVQISDNVAGVVGDPQYYYRGIDIGHTAQKMKFSIKDFFSKCDQTHMKLRIWSHLLKKSLLESFIFCGVEEEGDLFSCPITI